MSKSRRNRVDIRTKAIVGVAEMASMLRLSRSRFYQLMGSTFPWPVYHIRTKKPFFPEELQAICRDVVRNNRGFDGRTVLFYRPRSKPIASGVKSRPKGEVETGPIINLIGALKSIGLKRV
ncbi:MAG TPA: hypothetical protein VN933_05650, partial [Candidatus Eremiobacteraceae bacterium]|nr:hypothetical protein [Candidatus Eremiobacteraceae bacterium]